MRNRTLLKLKSLFLVHNLSLTAASGTLLALYIEGLVQILVRKGVFYAICDRRGGWTQHLVFLYYVGLILARGEGGGGWHSQC